MVMANMEYIDLRSALPSDSPHILVWDNLTEIQLSGLALHNNAKRISHRQDWLQRLPPNGQFLNLDYRTEIQAIRALCQNTPEPVVILEDLDYLISYLSISPDSPITTFWFNLAQMRHLPRLLWLVLPSLWVPSDWDTHRLLRFTP
jgi:hypothetical protein